MIIIFLVLQASLCLDFNPIFSNLHFGQQPSLKLEIRGTDQTIKTNYALEIVLADIKEITEDTALYQGNTFDDSISLAYMTSPSNSFKVRFINENPPLDTDYIDLTISSFFTLSLTNDKFSAEFRILDEEENILADLVSIHSVSPNKLTNYSITAENNKVGMKSTHTFKFDVEQTAPVGAAIVIDLPWLQTDMPNKKDRVSIFPKDEEVVLLDSVGIDGDAKMTVEFIVNKLVIQNAFGVPFTGSVSLVIDKLYLPDSTSPKTGYFVQIVHQNYVIHESEGGMVTATTPGDLNGIQIDSTVNSVEATANFTFSFDAPVFFPYKASIQLEFPKEFELSDSEITKVIGKGNLTSFPAFELSGQTLLIKEINESRVKEFEKVEFILENLKNPVKP